MREKISFEINKNTDGILEAEVLISEPLEVLSIMVDVEQVEMLMGYLFLQDESGKTRFQKLLGYSERVIQIGPSSECTTIGGVPGKIGQGSWKLTLCIFTEEVRKYLGHRRYRLPLKYRRKKGNKESIGEECWVSKNKNALCIMINFRGIRNLMAKKGGIKGIFIRIRDCQMEKKLLQMQWRRQSRCKWISMYRRSTM